MGKIDQWRHGHESKYTQIELWDTEPVQQARGNSSSKPFIATRKGINFKTQWPLCQCVNAFLNFSNALFSTSHNSSRAIPILYAACPGDFLY